EFYRCPLRKLRQHAAVESSIETIDHANHGSRTSTRIHQGSTRAARGRGRTPRDILIVKTDKRPSPPLQANLVAVPHDSGQHAPSPEGVRDRGDQPGGSARERPRARKESR